MQLMNDVGNDGAKSAIRSDRRDDKKGGNHEELLSDGHSPQHRQLVLVRTKSWTNMS